MNELEEYVKGVNIGYRQGIKDALGKFPDGDGKVIMQVAFQPDYVIELSTIKQSIEDLLSNLTKS